MYSKQLTGMSLIALLFLAAACKKESENMTGTSSTTLTVENVLDAKPLVKYLSIQAVKNLI